MKCTKCGSTEDLTSKTNGYCRPCRNAYMRDWYRNKRKTIEGSKRERTLRMYSSAKKRAKRQGVPFDICVDDIVIPDVCPVLGIDISVKNEKISDNSPTLDKLIPEIGYVKGNVIVMSAKANRIKSNATHEEILMVAEWLKMNT